MYTFTISIKGNEMSKQEIIYKNVKVPLDIHTRLKQQAAESNQTMVAYLSQCLTQCKSSKKSS